MQIFTGKQECQSRGPGQAIIPRLQAEHGPRIEENIALLTCRSLIYLGSMWLWGKTTPSDIWWLVNACLHRHATLDHEGYDHRRSRYRSFMRVLGLAFELYNYIPTCQILPVSLYSLAKSPSNGSQGWKSSTATWQWHPLADFSNVSTIQGKICTNMSNHIHVPLNSQRIFGIV